MASPARVSEIAEGILQIDVPIDHPLKNFNIYLFLGEEPTLLDVGPRHPLLRDFLEELLQKKTGGRLSRILITHSHIDHFGMAAEVRRFTDARVTCHPEEISRIHFRAGGLEEEFRRYAEVCVKAGLPEDYARGILRIVRMWEVLAEPCPVDETVEGERRIKAGCRWLRVLHTPGHTAGHLCFLEEEEGVLFSGDHLMKTITPNPELYVPPREGSITGLGQFLESLVVLKGRGIKRAFPGHGKTIRNVDRRVEMNLLHHRRRLEKTMEAVKEGKRTPWEVALRLFPQVRRGGPGIDHYLAIKEALGHLAILEERGMIVKEEDGDRWIYRYNG